MKIFSDVGSLKTIRTYQPQASNGGATSASRAAKADGMLFNNKASELNKEGNWRHSLRVRLLRQPAKPAQTRGKKAT
ncbi:hypothetical protein Hanom_Chr04g00286901 [Helianthus anomalus]